MDKPEGFPFFMNDGDIEFFKAAGFQHFSMAEFRRWSAFGKQTIELMAANGGYWTAHYRSWEGPKALTCQAAFVAAELENWGDDRPLREKLDDRRNAANAMRREFKESFTG